MTIDFSLGDSFPSVIPHVVTELHPDEILPQLHEPKFPRHSNCPHYSPIDQTSGTCTVAKENGLPLYKPKTHCDNYAACEVYASVKRSLS